MKIDYVTKHHATQTWTMDVQLHLRYTYIACLVSNAHRKTGIRFLYVIARVESSFGQNLMFIFPKGPLKIKL